MAHETSPLLGLPLTEWKTQIHPVLAKVVFITALIVAAYSLVAFVISGVDLTDCNLRINLPAIFAAYTSLVGATIYISSKQITITKFMISFAFTVIGTCLYLAMLTITIVEPKQCPSIYSQQINASIGGLLNLVLLIITAFYIETVSPVAPNII
jgi:hypothetical protein